MVIHCLEHSDCLLLAMQNAVQGCSCALAAMVLVQSLRLSGVRPWTELLAL